MDLSTQTGLQSESARRQALRFLEQRNYRGAIEALEKSALLDQTGESYALMGLACYQSEDYGQACSLMRILEWFRASELLKHRKRQRG